VLVGLEGVAKPEKKKKNAFQCEKETETRKQ
jgi:hypothetical protein